MDSKKDINAVTAHLFRENSGKMAAVLSGYFGLGRLDMVMDIVQETFETALQKWRYGGVPENPAGWLMQVAKNKALNVLKKEKRSALLTGSVIPEQRDSGFSDQYDLLLLPETIQDSQLRLLFTCAHPGLSPKNQVLITLYLLCGFGVPEISNALRMQEEAVKKAITRSKIFLRESGNLFQLPLTGLVNERASTVLTVLYLMFNEGYKTTRSPGLLNTDLCFEATRLAKLMANQTGAWQSESEALLALFFFNISRFPARLDNSGNCNTLAEQDRSRWNKALIEEGCYYLKKATQTDTLSRFHLEALIASLHCAAATFNETNWEKIVYLYRQLEMLEPDCRLIKLNRILAESYTSGSQPLEAVKEMEVGLDWENNFLLFAAKGNIYYRKGLTTLAQNAFEQAFDQATSLADKKFIKRKIQECLNVLN